MTDKFKMNIEENIAYAKRNIIDMMYKSARLEGIAITFPETNEIYEGRNVAHLSVDEVVKVNNLKHCWEFVFNNIDYDVDLRYIKQVNEIIQKDLHPLSGQVRTIDVSIGGTDWKPEIPNEEEVKNLINGIMTSNKTNTEKAIDTMLFIMRTQIFYDGNKRTAQLVANQIMIKNGCGIIAIPVDRQRTFLELLVDFYETDNAAKIKKFLYSNCIDGYNREKNLDKKTSSKGR